VLDKGGWDDGTDTQHEVLNPAATLTDMSSIHGRNVVLAEWPVPL
jgi:hypothetical protein